VVDILKQITKPAALVGIAEKGYLTTRLTVQGAGGHSSMPTRESTIATLAQAVARLHDNQMPSSISGALKEMLTFIAPEAKSWLERLALSNIWLFGPLILRQLDAGPSAASIRTSTAVTMFHSGIQDNVLPQVATATVNFRILPGETIADCLAHIRKVVNDPRVSVETTGAAQEASPVSPTNSQGWDILQQTYTRFILKLLWRLS